ncbi:hypothetical protein K488DRAFT_66868, partial [Vararia minispora EC-137]
MFKNPILNMPVPNGKGAPEKFTGKASLVEQFLWHFESLCKGFGVKNEQDKCRQILRYCSGGVREVIEGTEAYNDGDWSALKRTIRKLYNAEYRRTRFTLADLKAHIATTSRQEIPDMDAWNKYVRGYTKLAGLMRNSNKLDREDFDRYLWMGINEDLQSKAELKM